MLSTIVDQSSQNLIVLKGISNERLNDLRGTVSQLIEK